MLVDSVAWQFRCVRLGFEAVIDTQCLEEHEVTSEQLHALVCGCDAPNSDFDFLQHFGWVYGAEMQGESNGFREAFEEVMSSLCREEKR